MPSVSISIVLYNNTVKTVNNLVRNIEKSTNDLSDVKLYLVNNSPENESLTTYLRTFESTGWIQTIVPETNGGFGSGNNLVLPYLHSDYHIVMNPDIMISSERELDKMIEYLENNTDVGLLSPLIKFPNGEIQHLLKRKSSVLDMAIRFISLPGTERRKAWFINLPDGYSHTHKAENVPGSFLVFRTSVFKKIGGFDEKYFLYMEDCDITMKVNEVSNTVFFPNAFVYHEWQRENRKSIKGIYHMISSMFVYFNKWGWKLY
ncbi:glycosyltransferase [Lactiplantibacillus argentoratensis]|uniref:Glycosyltransferase family 2 protein n=1 Tax=Lactiplantibacillus argentoratensis TaxID=271881 RepID=A0ABS5UFV4_9LACO|nr:glycosyltransferase [Lactiplantibacillus argentoratensis]KZU13888.1 Glycosyl transferase group 2 family protein [Lactiplantibacillus plantarum]MBT1137464.1 glycosyltransferase family 2 protein [Lactiplantibacillus argentoratensis]MBT1140322.1 glycosyltransferase family 2 protein [Lactiplantibacillus argentoratensis]